MGGLTYGMVGGGVGSFIGAVHRKAIRMTGQADLVAGALSSTPERCVSSAKELGLDPERGYESWEQMLERERERPDPIDFVAIVTPNDMHYPVAKAALEAGFHVVMDKPMTHTAEQAAELGELARQSGRVLAVTYNYTGYPMVRQAAEMVAAGEIGAVRKVFVEYHQGWLATKLEDSGQKQADWRVDPKRAGLGGALGDIGTHAENLVSFITGLEIESLCADKSTFVPGRMLDDDASVLMRFAGGAKGTLTCSQVCVGELNNLTIRVYGERGALKWCQQTPESLEHVPIDGPPRSIWRGGPGVGERGSLATSIPGGHPEGFHDAFSNIYRGAIEAMIAMRDGREAGGLAAEFPTAADGWRGVRFVELAVESSNNGSVWVDFK